MPRLLHLSVVFASFFLFAYSAQAAGPVSSDTGGAFSIVENTERGERFLDGSDPIRSEESRLDDVLWTGDGDGTRWDDAGNWSTGIVPDVNDHAIITKDGDYEVLWSTNGVNASVGQITLGGASGTQRLRLSAGTRFVDGGVVVGVNGHLIMQSGITSTAPIQIDGHLEWLSRTLTADLTNDGTITLPGGSQTLDGALVNNGSFVVTNARMRTAENASILNAGVMELVYSNADFFSALSAGNGSTFTNTGTLTKTGVAHFRMFLPSVVDGTVDVQEGRLDFEGGVEFIEGVSLSTAVDANTEITGDGDLKLPPTLSHSGGGKFLVELATGRSIDVASAGTTINFSDPGFTWRNGILDGGTLTNVGYVNFEFIQYVHSGGTFINDGVVTGGSTVGGSFTLRDASTFRNNGEMLLSSFVKIRALEGDGTFVNADGALFVAPAGVQFQGVSGGILTFDLMGTMTWNGAVGVSGEVIINNAAKWEVAGADSVGSIGWVRSFEMGPEAELVIDVTTDGQDYFGDASFPTFAGKLSVRVASDRTLVDGERFFIAGGNGFVVPGFTDRESLTVESQGKSLYQEVNKNYWLTVYDGIQTLSGALASDPTSGTSRETVGLALAGEGFSPDMTATLECDGCEDPIGSATIPGIFYSITPGEASVQFDLDDGDDVLGSYKLVLTDPRGGRAETAFTVNEAEPIITVEAIDADASERLRDRGLILVTTERPVRTALSIPFTLSGSAKMYSDYLTDVQGEILDIPRDADSVYVSIIPLTDDQVESDETAVLTLTYPGPVNGSNSATVTISDGPATADFVLFGFSPQRGGNCNLVTLEVYGQGFSETNTVTLTGIGDPIQSVAQEVDETGTVLSATFLMDGQPTGERTVRVHNGSEELAATGQFVIEEATYPGVFVQVLAQPAFGRNRSVVYTVLLRNRSNIDVTGYVSLAGTGINDGWSLEEGEFEFDNDPDAPWSEVLPPYVVDEWTVLGLPQVTLRAGETRRMPVRNTASSTHDVIGSWSYVW